MRLVYKETGIEVQLGDIVETSKGNKVRVEFFREPHKPSSSGKVSVKFIDQDWSQEFYVQVIGAEWIEREDRV